MARYYAGIGSRRTPPDILDLMTIAAGHLCELGFILRSGGAVGADSAFEKGSSNSIILRPKNATPDAIKFASTVHPAWHMCDEHAQKLHGRNVMIILGEDLQTPVEFVICWHDPQVMTGGTRLGMQVAKDHNILVFNLAVSAEISAFGDLCYNINH